MDSKADVQFFALDEEIPYTALPGVHMRAVFGERAMLNLIELEPGAEVSAHSHPHEQLGIVLRGTQILRVANEEHELGPNSAYVLKGGVVHSGRGGPQGCLVIDVFQPVREDYREAIARWRADNDMS